MAAIIPARWEGDCFRPLPSRAAECDALYVVGQVYALTECERRSGASHAHYFAAIAEAWGSLPDLAARRIGSPEHLRKLALIRTGYRDERTMVAGSAAEARRLAAFMRPMDELAVVSVEGATVTVWTAQSQSMRAMGKARFQASKTAVLDYIAEKLGTTPAALADAGRAAA